MYIHIPYIAESPIAASYSFTACFKPKQRQKSQNWKQGVNSAPIDRLFLSNARGLHATFPLSLLSTMLRQPGPEDHRAPSTPLLSHLLTGWILLPPLAFLCHSPDKKLLGKHRALRIASAPALAAFSVSGKLGPTSGSLGSPRAGRNERLGHTEHVWSRGQGCNPQLLMVETWPSEPCLPGDDTHVDPGLEGPAQGWGGGHGVHQKVSWSGGWEGAPLAWVLVTKSTHPKLILRCCSIAIQEPATPELRISAGQPKIYCPPIFWVQVQQGSVISLASRWRWDIQAVSQRPPLPAHCASTPSKMQNSSTDPAISFFQ